MSNNNARAKIRRKRVRRPCIDRNERGSTMAEYALVASLIAGVCFATVAIIGGQVNLLFQSFTLN